MRSLKRPWYFLLLVLIAVCVHVGVSIHYYTRTFLLFNTGLPSPEEVAGWDENKTKNSLYKLSRWNAFEDGEQFKQLILSEIRPLGKNASDRFHFLEAGMGGERLLGKSSTCFLCQLVLGQTSRRQQLK